jgi:hypothetical protein
MITGVCTPQHHTLSGAVFIPASAVLSCSSCSRMAYVSLAGTAVV